MMHCPIFRKNKSFFLSTQAPAPHLGWTLKAFQEYCRIEMEAAGFNFKAPVKCVYDPKSGDVVFWQENSEISFSYSLN